MKLKEISESLNERVDDLDVIADRITNDETSTDEEMAYALSSVTNYDYDDLYRLVKAERDNFLGHKYMMNTIDKDKEIIRSYVD